MKDAEVTLEDGRGVLQERSCRTARLTVMFPKPLNLADIDGGELQACVTSPTMLRAAPVLVFAVSSSDSHADTLKSSAPDRTARRTPPAADGAGLLATAVELSGRP